MSGAPPWGQPWTPAVTLPQGCTGPSARRMAVLWTFREFSLCRHVRRELMRNAWLDFTPIIPVTACHQSNHVETYSRYTSQSKFYEVASGNSRRGLHRACRLGVPRRHDPGHTEREFADAALLMPHARSSQPVRMARGPVEVVHRFGFAAARIPKPPVALALPCSFRQ